MLACKKRYILKDLRSCKLTPPMTLPKETMEKIRAEAKERCPLIILSNKQKSHVDRYRIEYHAGATEWAGKAQPVVDALEALLNILPSGSVLDHYFAKEQVIKAREALAKYKEVENG
jgi:hypothetical protein